MATTTRHGRLNEFDADNETVTAYLERVELYFDANNVAEDKKVPVLLRTSEPKRTGCCGPERSQGKDAGRH